jgi:hypothetical protein
MNGVGASQSMPFGQSTGSLHDTFRDVNDEIVVPILIKVFDDRSVTNARQTPLPALARKCPSRFGVGNSRCRKTFGPFGIFPDIRASGFLNINFYQSAS